MTTNSPSKALPRYSILAVQNPPLLPKEPYLLDGFHPRGEPLALHGPTADHPMHPGGRETYGQPDRAPMRQEFLRSAPHPHAFYP